MLHPQQSGCPARHRAALPLNTRRQMELKDIVKEKYGEAALRAQTGSASSCCGASAAFDGCDPITSNLYNASQTGDLPEAAVLASLGCGNPTALAELHAG